jgi:hypothetical protein
MKTKNPPNRPESDRERRAAPSRSTDDETFPPGARFYEWNTLPMATVPGPKGRKFFNYVSDLPCEIFSLEGLHSAREISRGEFDQLRARMRTLLACAQNVSSSKTSAPATAVHRIEL